MNATRTSEVGTTTTTEYFGGPEPDVLLQGNGAATVSVTAGYSSSYGQAKCSVTVTLACDQTKKAIKMAYDLGFDYANTLAVDGYQRVLQDFANMSGSNT